MSAIFIILAQFFVMPLFAATLDVPVKEGDRLVLKGFEAQVQLSAQAGTTLKISGVDEGSQEGAYMVTKKDNVIEVKMNDFDGKKGWLNVLTKPSAHLKKLEIQGPALPSDIQLRGGSVVVQKWNKDLKISLTQGRVSSLSGAGALQVYVQKGDVNIQDHTGKVEADSYSGSMALKNIQGDVDASLFSGQMQLEKVRGFISLNTQQSNAKVNASSGTVQFENGRGSLNIQSFQGRMEGQSQEGSVTISMALDSEVDVKTKSGKVSIQLPPASGALLNLVSLEGELVVPGELKVNKQSSEKSVRGRLRGDAQRASVFVRSQDGTISVK